MKHIIEEILNSENYLDTKEIQKYALLLIKINNLESYFHKFGVDKNNHFSIKIKNNKYYFNINQDLNDIHKLYIPYLVNNEKEKIQFHNIFILFLTLHEISHIKQFKITKEEKNLTSLVYKNTMYLTVIFQELYEEQTNSFLIEQIANVEASQAILNSNKIKNKELLKKFNIYVAQILYESYIMQAPSLCMHSLIENLKRENIIQRTKYRISFGNNFLSDAFLEYNNAKSQNITDFLEGKDIEKSVIDKLYNISRTKIITENLFEELKSR